ncbi:MAG: radical SAM protein, partial [Candidatus Lokiarchaeota archaeon]|nr:radical SAM protein [Candidatus Lokiarchaeota archaeon]
MTTKKVWLRFEHIQNGLPTHEFQIDYIRFADDLFTLKKEKIMEFCNLMIKEKLPINFRIQARVDCIDEEMLISLKDAGCDLIEYGAESGSDKVLKINGKNITVKKIKKAVELTRKVGIEVKFFLIVGLLEEGPEETWDTFKLIKETKPDWVG